MTESEEGFLTWARDGARTVEEKFGIELLVEVVYAMFCHGAGLAIPAFHDERKKQDARKFNPAYEPEIPRWKLEFVAGKLGEVKELRLGDHYSDRPLRDVSFLVFLPGLVGLHLGSLEREDLDGVQHLTGLRNFSLRSSEVEDYGALGSCRGLREIGVYTGNPWPRLEGLDGLPELEVLAWQGRVSALASIKRLPALRHLQMGGIYFQSHDADSVRDFHSLPEMPLLEHLWGGWFYRLDGVERFPRLRFMMVMTFAKNLSALVPLGQLTHLRVAAPRLDRLEDVARIPSLLHFALYSERPQDWGVVLESPSLREVHHFLDYETKVDLGMTDLLLPNYDEFFAAAEARPLQPFRLRVNGKPEDMWAAPAVPLTEFPDGPDGWNGNIGMRLSETKWVVETLREALRKAGFLNLQGVRLKIDEVNAHDLFYTLPIGRHSRTIWMNILKTEAIAKLPGICECLRLALSNMRYRWLIVLMVNAEPDADEWDETWRGEDEISEAEQERQNEADRQFQLKRKRILLEDQLRARMLRELGEDLSTFKPSPRPATPYDPHNAPEPEDEEEVDDEKDDDASGGIAEYDEEKAQHDESWLPPVTLTDPNKAWSDLHCMIQFDEEAIYMHIKSRGLEHICDLFDLEPEEEK